MLDVLDVCRDYNGPAVLVRTSTGVIGYTVFVNYTRNQHLPGHSNYRIMPLTDEGAFKSISLETIKCEASVECGIEYGIRPYEDFLRKYPKSPYFEKAAAKASEGYAEYSKMFKEMAVNSEFKSQFGDLYTKWTPDALRKEAERYMKLSLKFKRLIEQKEY
jgi:hypothetical protein